MKKLMIVFTVIGMLGMSSCVKNWTCQCVVNNTSVTNTPISGGTFIHARHTCNSMANDSQQCSLLTDNK